VNGFADALLCISKSSKQANDLRGGMWQTGHTFGRNQHAAAVLAEPKKRAVLAEPKKRMER
jgi:hypothetical protein